jgi:hypothetical protein
MRELLTQIEIKATPERVWDILTNFPAYPQWNPFIQRIEGEASVGSTLAVTLKPPGGRAVTFKPTVVEAAPKRELRWLGRVLVPRIFDGEHSLRIEVIDASRIRFVQSESFGGALVPLFGRIIDKTQNGFTAMNDALKRRAEAGPLNP